MAYIPIDLWREILVRIRVEELMRLRCVCSSWLDLIDCQVFRAQHSTRPSSFPAQNLIVYSRQVYYMLGLEKISPGNEPISEPIRARVVKIKSGLDDQPRTWGLLEHSNNGLVLLLNSFSYTSGVCAWNPITRRHQNLHDGDLIIEEDGYSMYHGIGFDEISRDCKAVLIRHHYYSGSSDAYVCKLRSPSCWKLMDPFPLPALHFPSLPTHDGVFVSGALHWIVLYKNDMQYRISVLSIHLGTEKYKLIPLPVARDSIMAELCVLGGCLCMSLPYFRSDGRLEAWVMKEYGFENSWSKLYTVKPQELGCQVKTHTPSRPLAYSYCGSQVLILVGGHLVWYHLRNMTVQHIVLEGWQELEDWPSRDDERRSFIATEYAGSFLPMSRDTMEREIPALCNGIENRLRGIGDSH